MTAESGRPFLFAFLAVALLMFGVGSVLFVYNSPAPWLAALDP